jgi:hypothetical protein
LTFSYYDHLPRIHMYKLDTQLSEERKPPTPVTSISKSAAQTK